MTINYPKPMTVAQLRVALEGVPDDALVVTTDNESGYFPLSYTKQFQGVLVSAPGWEGGVEEVSEGGQPMFAID